MAKRTISGKSIAADVVEGMGDTFLMERYNLTPNQLELVLRKLLDANLITDMQLYERTTLSDSIITKAFVEKKWLAESPYLAGLPGLRERGLSVPALALPLSANTTGQPPKHPQPRSEPKACLAPRFRNRG